MTDTRWPPAATSGRRDYEPLALQNGHRPSLPPSLMLSGDLPDRDPPVGTLPAGGGTAHAHAVEAVRRYIESLPKPMPFKKEVKSCGFWRAVWTEFVVTLLFLVIGCGAGIQWGGGVGGVSEDLKAALAVGLTVAALVQSAGHISGCHLNPAVTITLLVTRSITPLRTASYVLAQCLGAVVGAGILYALTPADVRVSGLKATVLHPSVHPSQAFGVEFLITLFVLITLIATYDCHQVDSCFKGLPIGVAYTVGHLFGVYWVGPILGGIIGGITYEYIHDTSAPAAQRNNHVMGSVRRRRQDAKTDHNVSAGHETEMTATSNDYRV